MRRILTVATVACLIAGWSAYAQLRVAEPQQVSPAGGAVEGVRRLDVNRASVDELCRLPGINRVQAEKIVAHRPYKRLDDLVARRVLGKKQFARVREYVKVGERR